MDQGTSRILMLVALAILLLAALGLCSHRVAAHDQSRPGLNSWFENLASKKGKCCSNYDGALVKDADWEQLPPVGDNGVPRYKVKIGDNWFDVPEDAVVTEPNRSGIAMVWGSRSWLSKNGTQSEDYTIRCFMPGTLY